MENKHKRSNNIQSYTRTWLSVILMVGLALLHSHSERHKEHTYIKHISERRIDRRKEVKSTTCLIIESVCPS